MIATLIIAVAVEWRDWPVSNSALDLRINIHPFCLSLANYQYMNVSNFTTVSLEIVNLHKK